jgi:glucuronoarabinoxylan endo-1,4-beta-xylanase
MGQRLVICFFILVGLAFNVQTVHANITGKVVNQAGKGIDKAILSLAVLGAKDTTDTSGAFLIATVGVLPQLTPRTEKIALNRGVLEFSLSNTSPVKVEIFNLKGDLLKKEYLPYAIAGFYRLNIADNSHASNMLFINASIGERTSTFRYLPLHNGKYAMNSSVQSSVPISGKLAKVTVVNDTLKIAATGYTPQSKPITSYDQVLTITLDPATGGPVTVQLAQTKQKMEGFGINDAWQPAFSDALVELLFDSTKGIGLSILRVGMESDGSGMGDWNNCKKAKAKGVKTFIGSVWTAPATDKTNNSLNGGGFLKTTSYESWAKAIAAFPAKVKSSGGVDLYAMGLANEPDFASCGFDEPCNGDYKTMVYNDSQMVAFTKIAGPKLHAAGCKVIAPEPSEWIHLWSDTSACCSENNHLKSSDPLKCGFPPTCAPGKGYDYGHGLAKDTAAWNQVDIIGVHQYDTQVPMPWPSDVPTMKPVFQTEMSGVKWWANQGPSKDINNGVVVARWVHDAIVNGLASAWCWWWPQPLSDGTDDNEGLMMKNGDKAKRLYTYGNFSKFVRPGMTRVAISGDIPVGVLLSAYKGGDGTVVIVAIDSSSTAASVPITIAGGTAPTAFTPWVTSATEDLKSGTAVTVTGGILTATLPAKTVTTFVGK